MNALDLNDPYWMEMLVDNELSASEREMLLRHLESSPSGWRQCAMAFVNAQVLETDLLMCASLKDKPKTTTKSTDAAQNPVTIPQSTQLSRTRQAKQSRPTTHGNVGYFATIAVCVLLSITATLAWQRWNSTGEAKTASITRFSSSQSNGSTDDDYVLSEIVRTIVESRLSQFASVSNDSQTCLIEILDNEYVWIFETPDLLPPLILESLVLAGHQVEIQEASGASDRVMNRIVVKKTPVSKSVL